MSQYGKFQTAVLPNVVQTGVTSGYASGDYGSGWATTAAINSALATCANPANGDHMVLWNTNGSAGRIYAYAAGAWHYVALT